MIDAGLDAVVRGFLEERKLGVQGGDEFVVWRSVVESDCHLGQKGQNGFETPVVLSGKKSKAGNLSERATLKESGEDRRGGQVGAEYEGVKGGERGWRR